MKLKGIVNFIVLFTTLTVSSQENLYTSFSIPDNLKQNANAVVRLNDLKVTIESQQKVQLEIKRVITVLNEKGNVNIDAGSGYDKYVKIKKIEAFVFDENGKEIKKIKKKDFIDHSAVDGGTLYSDSRVLFMGYTPTNYPYTVEFNCEIETSNTAAIPSWRPIQDYFLSIEKDSYVLNDLANLGLRFKEKNLESFNVEKTKTDLSASYSLINVPAVKPENLSPIISKFTPEVQIAVEKFHYNGIDGNAKNWVEFGDWIKTALLDGRNQVSDETKQKIVSLVEGVEDPLEKAKIVYKYVQDNTRYISVQVGIGGIQPIPAIEVDELKYGDCKGLTNYTQALLNVADVESYYTIVQAGKQIVDFDSDFASLEQGNHIILGIPNKDDMIWLDCTSQIHPFNFIGDFTDDRSVLIIKEGASEILKTITYADSVNHQYSQANIKLNADASIQSDLIIKTRGIQYDNRFPLERQSEKDIIEYYKESWGYVNNLEIINYSFKNDKKEVEFTEKLKLYARRYASSNGEKLIFTVNAFNKNSFIPNRYRNRKLSLEIQRGYLDEDSFTYTIPEGFQIESIPQNILLKNQFGEYSLEFSSVDDKIIYKRKLLISKGKYPKSDYTAYRNFRKRISNLDNSKIILKRI